MSQSCGLFKIAELEFCHYKCFGAAIKTKQNKKINLTAECMGAASVTGQHLSALSLCHSR